MNESGGGARLSKDGAHVLCAMIDCGQVLGWIMEPDPKNAEKERFVWLPPGWAPRKGDKVWALSTRSKRRLRQGRSSQAIRVYANTVPSTPVGWRPRLDVPCEIVCPACGLRQRLDADALGLPAGRWPWPASEHNFGGVRQLRPGPELERWQRAPLRFQ
jgi:hypothetical protein